MGDLVLVNLNLEASRGRRAVSTPLYEDQQLFGQLCQLTRLQSINRSMIDLLLQCATCYTVERITMAGAIMEIESDMTQVNIG